MRRAIAMALAALLLVGCAGGPGKTEEPTTEQGAEPPRVTSNSLYVKKVEGLGEDFILGAEDGHGYGGGNCTAKTAGEIGARAAKYGMKLLVDFHYSDFWADPSKQQAPKAWAGLDEYGKAEKIRAYTAESLAAIRDAGADIGMVQIGNETTKGLCGEKAVPKMCALYRAGAEAVRDRRPLHQPGGGELQEAGLYAGQQSGGLRRVRHLLLPLLARDAGKSERAALRRGGGV